MRVARWGDHLVVLLSSQAVQDMGLVEGDEVDFVDLKRRPAPCEKRDPKAEFLKAMDQFHWPAPDDYKFDRDEANAR
jgi:antitoxin MazE